MEFFTLRAIQKLKEVKSNYAKKKKTSNLCKSSILEIMSKV